MFTGYEIGNKALPIGNITVFSFHCINGNYPLFTKLTNINTVYKFTVRNRLAECALIKSPKFSRIGINDVFGQSGTPDSLFEEYGLTAEHAVTDIKNLLSK